MNFSEVFDAFPEIRLTLDIGHANLGAGRNKSSEFIRLYGYRIGHVHACDNFGKEDSHLPVGAGIIDFRKILRELKETQYDDTITLEVFSKDRDYLKISRDKAETHVGGSVILAFIFSILVALFWLSRFRKMDKYEKEPERLITLTFLAGALSTVPSVILERLFHPESGGQSLLLGRFVLSYLWVALVEEFFKFLAVRLTAYRSRQFNEVMDGMIYMISSALGFAATENVAYMLGFGFSTGILRAILSYLGTYFLFSNSWLLLGKGKNRGKRKLALPGFFLRRLLSLAL